MCLISFRAHHTYFVIYPAPKLSSMCFSNNTHPPVCATAQTRPARPNTPPRRTACSRTSARMSAPMAPCTSTAIPYGCDTSCATWISTSPEMGGRSGDAMTMRARRGSEVNMAPDPEMSGIGPGEAGRYTFTGILRGMTVPAGEKKLHKQIIFKSFVLFNDLPLKTACNSSSVVADSTGSSSCNSNEPSGTHEQVCSSSLSQHCSLTIFRSRC